MYEELLPMLRSPVCGGSFRLECLSASGDEIIDGSLVCDAGHSYAIRYGVVDFCSAEQDLANNWSEAYKETDYDSLDLQIENEKSAEEKRHDRLLLDRIAEETVCLKQGTVVDIASGRGMLLRALAARIDSPINLIATDLSFEVLKYDRLKLKKINPKLRASYIACDASALPLADSCADMTVSFFGIANMLGLVEQGIGEAARITKKGGSLLNASMLIKKASNGFALVKQVCAEHGLAGEEAFYLQEGATALHEKHFDSVVLDTACEGVKDGNENTTDLLPYPNEWYAEVIFKCTEPK